MYQKLHYYEWNKLDQLGTILFLDEDEILTNSKKAFAGPNWEIIVVPNKYREEKNEMVEYGIKIATLRGGRVIYI